MSPQQYTRNKQEKHRTVRETKRLPQADRDKHRNRQKGRQADNTDKQDKHTDT